MDDQFAQTGRSAWSCRSSQRFESFIDDRARNQSQIKAKRIARRFGRAILFERGSLPQCGKNSSASCRIDLVITLASSGSPFSSVVAKALASLSEICGGSGGMFGSVFTSSTQGRSDENASSQHAPTFFGSSQ